MLDLRSRFSTFALVALFVAAASMLFPYATPILMGAILCVVGWPAQRWLEDRFHLPRQLAAALHALAWLALIVVPAAIIVSTVAANLSPMIPKWQSGKALFRPPEALARIPVVGHWLWSRLHAVNADVLLHFLGKHKDLIRLWLGGAWLLVLHTAVAAMMVFVLALRGERTAADVTGIANRLWGADGPAVLSIAVRSAQAVMLGIVGVGVGEGLLIGAAFAIGGVPLWSIWMVATILLSPVPFGAAAVLALACGWLVLSGSWIAAVVILVWGLAVIALADLLFRPVVTAQSGQVSFLLVLLSILGGAKMLGLIGVVAGPLLLTIAAGIWQQWVRGSLDSTKPPLTPPSPGV
ncbi:MAG: AI-2E family transporter, partial [Acidiferrobacteraceae bacterium]